jgi:hypothetical protein
VFIGKVDEWYQFFCLDVNQHPWYFARSGFHERYKYRSSYFPYKIWYERKLLHGIYFYIMSTSLGYAQFESTVVNFTTYTDDNSFGPFLKLPNSTTFDFTALFEEAILSIAPSTFLLLLIPLRVLSLWKRPRKVIGSRLQTIKIVSFVVCSCKIDTNDIRHFSLSLVSCRSSISLKFPNRRL